MLCPHGPTDPTATVDDDHADDIVYPSTIPFLLVHLGLLGRGSTVYRLISSPLIGADRTDGVRAGGGKPAAEDRGQNGRIADAVAGVRCSTTLGERYCRVHLMRLPRARAECAAASGPLAGRRGPLLCPGECIVRAHPRCHSAPREPRAYLLGLRPREQVRDIALRIHLPVNLEGRLMVVDSTSATTRRTQSPQREQLPPALWLRCQHPSRWLKPSKRLAAFSTIIGSLMPFGRCEVSRPSSTTAAPGCCHPLSGSAGPVREHSLVRHSRCNHRSVSALASLWPGFHRPERHRS